MNIAATGKPYEIFVITPKPVWNGAVGDTLRHVFGQEVDWINQPEPLFDLFNIIPNSINDVARRHRNMFLINCDSKRDSVTFSVRENVWVDGQVVMELNAPNQQLAANYIGENSETIVDFLSIVEKKRMNLRARKQADGRIGDIIAKKFDFRMIIPKGYRVANDKLPNFLWLTYEMPISSQGVAIYSFAKPAEGTKLNLIEERNRAIAQIPGPVDGSYMSTDTTFKPESNPVEINGQAWVETRGFWNVKGDFMGGPFINYITFDAASQQYIGIDLYVYSPSPKYPKRNYIRQMEALMLGVTIPKSKPTIEETAVN